MRMQFTSQQNDFTHPHGEMNSVNSLCNNTLSLPRIELYFCKVAVIRFTQTIEFEPSFQSNVILFGSNSSTVLLEIDSIVSLNFEHGKISLCTMLTRATFALVQMSTSC